MSARGARSRKAVLKDIEKKEAREKKSSHKGKAVATSPVPNTTTQEWRPTSSPDQQRAGTAMSRSISHSDASSGGKDKSKYDANGKQTKAPRGRGGGVPVKKPSTPTPPLFRAESSMRFPSGDASHKNWMNFRIWQGGDQGMRPYGGFDFDEDMQTGTVLIYFKEEQMRKDAPIPQLRADLQVLENAGSSWIRNALQFGHIDDGDDWAPTGSQGSPNARQSPYSNATTAPGQRHMLAPVQPGGLSPPPFNIDQTYYGVPGYASSSRAQYYPSPEYSGSASRPPSFQSVQQPTHELWFTAPDRLKTPQAQRLHHVAIRNFLALLHGKPIVGADLFEMLTTLQPEIQVMYDLDHDHQSNLAARDRSVKMITDYLKQHKLDDVRNSIKIAVNLLAWAEQDNVRWRQGYLESFVHLAGILNPQLEDLPDFKRLSINTRKNLGIAAKTMQLRVLEAEEKMKTLDFDDVWPDLAKADGTTVHQSYQAFRQFLLHYLTQTYGNWPPTQGQAWLNRKIVNDLQRDFGLLYDYLVNRDVAWDVREERPGYKWQMGNVKTDDFMANGPEIPLSDMFVSWDNKHGYAHIPHAYPLLPKDVPHAKSAPKKGFFGGLKKNKVNAEKDAKTHLQLSIVFGDATNMGDLDPSAGSNVLLEAFERLELGTNLKLMTPREARLGRWVLLHGILQVLSTISVDVQSLRYTDGVRYFLCADVKRCPEWVVNGQLDYLTASQQRSWCWQRPWDPTPITNEPAELHADGRHEMATIESEIHQIGDKISHLSMSSHQSHPYLHNDRSPPQSPHEPNSPRLYTNYTSLKHDQYPPQIPAADQSFLRDSSATMMSSLPRAQQETWAHARWYASLEEEGGVSPLALQAPLFAPPRREEYFDYRFERADRAREWERGYGDGG